MLMLRIERYLRARKMAPTRFGRDAVGDPCLIGEMRRGRRLRSKTIERVIAHLELVEGELSNTDEPR